MPVLIIDECLKIAINRIFYSGKHKKPLHIRRLNVSGDEGAKTQND